MIKLSASIPRERAKWLEIWESRLGREPFSHPSYVEAFMAGGDAAVLLVDSGDEPRMALPLIVKRLSSEAWCTTPEGARDASSPYGYGGPFGLAGSRAVAAEFWTAYEEWAAQERLVTTFLRLSLFLEEGGDPPWDVVEDRSNVVVPLNQSEALLWSGYEHKVRKNVNTALRAGLNVTIDDDGRGLSGFLEVYRETMERRGATAGYHLARPFFEGIVENQRGGYVFFHVWQGGEMVSSELVLLSDRYMYSFLGGTRAAAFQVRPNDLLKHEAALWGLRRGMSGFVLGGGYEQNDGIFRYKLAFAPRATRPFRVARRIHRPEEYARLTSLRSRLAVGSGSQWTPRPGFFPEYRG